MSQIRFVENDTGSTLTVVCTDQDDVIRDISLDTVRARWGVDGAKRSETMTITDGPNGKAALTFGEGDLMAGTMEFEVWIETPTGEIVTGMDKAAFPVRRRIGT
jgi:hypothetical protein